MARVLVTRPEPGATATARRLAALGHEPVPLPLSEIRALRPAIAAAGPVDILAATSANALRHLPPVPSALLAKPIFAVGGKTAEAARRAGFIDVREAGSDGAALAAAIASVAPEGTTILYLCGRVRRPEFERALHRAGMAVLPVEVYDTLFLAPGPAEVTLAASGRPLDSVLLYSPEAARAMASIIAGADPSALLSAASFLCLSTRVAAALGTAGHARTYVSMQPSEDALLALLPAA